MATEWNQVKLQRLIDDQVEESHSLEYKAAGALSVAKKDELSKDISAMANAAGGTLIYGIAGFNDELNRHLPEKLSPIARTEFSKERLEQLINSNIKPRIEGVVIYPVNLNSGKDDVAYVVEVPQGATAHQASDFRYYRRYNFEVLPMLDHEIRDVMGRNQHPKVTIELEFTRENLRSALNEQHPLVLLKIYACNQGSRFAKYVNCFVSIPEIILWNTGMNSLAEFSKSEIEKTDFKLNVTPLTNKHRDSQYGGMKYEPILPGLKRELGSFRIFHLNAALDSDRCKITWAVHADNAPVENGAILAREIPTRQIS
jgi:hypothetical protein